MPEAAAASTTTRLPFNAIFSDVEECDRCDGISISRFGPSRTEVAEI
jgi:hypothetical protein